MQPCPVSRDTIEQRTDEIADEVLTKSYSLVDVNSFITGQVKFDDILEKIELEHGCDIHDMLGMLMQVRLCDYQMDRKRAKDALHKAFTAFCQSADEILMAECRKAAKKELGV